MSGFLPLFPRCRQGKAAKTNLLFSNVAAILYYTIVKTFSNSDIFIFPPPKAGGKIRSFNYFET
jgi:hypothetical protein